MQRCQAQPSTLEAIRTVLLTQERSYAALMVSLAAHAGLRIPEEVLALEWRHVRDRTLLVEQRLIEGEIALARRCGTSARGRSIS